MKKVILGLAAVGAVFAVRPVVKRRMVQKMSTHCKQMAAHCAEMIGGHDEATGREAVHQKMREHGGGMAAQHDERAEPVASGVTDG
jgi:hypothetical protein